MWPWEIPEKGTQDTEENSQGWSLLVVVDRASTFPIACHLPTKEALGVVEKHLDLVLGVPKVRRGGSRQRWCDIPVGG